MRTAPALVALIIGGALLSLTGCTSGMDVTQPTSTPVETAAETPIETPVDAPGESDSVALIDPLIELTDPAAIEYISTNLTPLLHAEGTGPQTFTVDTSDPAVAQVRYFVSCRPDATFTVTMGVEFSSACSTSLGNTGSIPIAQRGASTAVTVDVPEGIDYWIVGIPIAAEPAVS